MSVSAQLRPRWTDKFDRHATTRVVKPHFLASLKAVDDIAALKAKINSDHNLSDSGKAAKFSNDAASFAGPIAKARRATAALAKSIGDQRAALIPSKKSDLDVEIRAFLRGKPLGEIVGLVNAEPSFLTAVLQAPAALSGINNDVRDQLLKAYLNQHAAPQLADIAEQEEALELHRVAIDVASGALATAVGVKLEKFEEWLQEKAPQAQPVSTPQQQSDENYERILAEARAEIAAIRASL